MAAATYLHLGALCILCSFQSSSALSNKALEECAETRSFGMTNGDITNDRVWVSSYTSVARQGHEARLMHNSAWQAQSNNYKQHLTIDLSRRQLIQSVATQGFRGSGQFVNAYYIQYSNDNTTYVNIVNDLAESELFEGNTNDDVPNRNFFVYPVVARYIRFVPQRWTINIAMRVEVYGCDFRAHTVQFDGKSAVIFDASPPVNLFTIVDMMRFRFKTLNPEGVIFYASGNQGDFVAMEISQGMLRFAMNLGTKVEAAHATQTIVGSLLDDGQWHDVDFIRDARNVTISVDRVPLNVTLAGEFLRLDIDRKLWLGGVETFYQPGLTVRNNFTGCIENFNWNGILMTQDARSLQQRFSTSGVLAYECKKEQAQLITFPEEDTFLEIETQQLRTKVSVKFNFRSYDEGGMIFYAPISGEPGSSEEVYVLLRLNNDGYLEYEVVPKSPSAGGFLITDIARNNHNNGKYTDGLWHTVDFVVQQNNITLRVDTKVYTTRRMLLISEQDIPTVFHMGGNRRTERGFVGCMRNIQIQDQGISVTDTIPQPYSDSEGSIRKLNGVLKDTCGLYDRCHPNPCEHEAFCTQSYTTFVCDCSATAYTGAICHQPKHNTSCRAIFELNQEVTEFRNQIVDIDGAGYLDPFIVDCRKTEQVLDDGVTKVNKYETIVHHDSEARMHVSGYQLPGSYSRNVKYAGSTTHMDRLVDRALSCQQSIMYECKNSKLLATVLNAGENPGANIDGTGDVYDNFRTYGWWVGRNNQRNYYWGGSAPGIEKCACGIVDDCIDKAPTCNCDSGRETSDSGYLYNKEHLPVLQLRFGDTGDTGRDKEGYHSLGPLECFGDILYDNPVTFRRHDAIIYFDYAQYQFHTWDMSFRFKTTAESGTFVHQVGLVDYINVKLVSATSLSFRYNSGYGEVALAVDTNYQLNDNEWHSVYAERNRKEARLQIDGVKTERVASPTNVGYRPFQFTSKLYVGASVDFKDGYVGCMSSILVNGEIFNLHEQVASGNFTYGLSLGCVGKCQVNPCLNGGICKERYSGFICDCSYTPYRGLICGREVGTNLLRGQLLEYRIPDTAVNGLDTDSETITVGFNTRKSKGVLLQLSDKKKDPSNYLIIELNNNGGIRVSFKFDKVRHQVNTRWLTDKGIFLSNGQHHVVRFTRYDKGLKARLQVDDYNATVEDMTKIFSEGADARLDNIRYVFIGRNSSNEASALEGCIYRTEFDNHWPLKRIFQEPTPSNTLIDPPDSAREERCGLEEILPEKEPEEKRPIYELADGATVAPPPTPETADGLNPAILGSILGVVAVILILLIGVIGLKCRQITAGKDGYASGDESDLEGLEEDEDDEDEEEPDRGHGGGGGQYQAQVKYQGGYDGGRVNEGDDIQLAPMPRAQSRQSVNSKYSMGNASQAFI